ncbi:MAG: PP2C family protein-serine/threonine phosphatase [Marmoricola sp.]
MLRISGAGETHVGLVRGNNEDSAFIGPYCTIVADGVGGGAAGEVASATATYAVAATANLMLGQDPATVLGAGVRLAQAQVHAGVVADPSREGMATTLTALVTDGKRFTLAHLGDSRGYVFREGSLVRVTRDHTYVQDLLDEGRLDPGDVAEHPWRNVVMRTISASREVEPDLLDLDLVPGDRFLLASDGLTDLIGEPELERTLSTRSDDEAVAALIAGALSRGGRDNVTCVVATIIEGQQVNADGSLLGAVRVPENIVDLAAARVESA